MPYLADTNVASRWMQPNDPHYADCRAAVRTLRARGEEVYIAPQVVTEYWALATRPIAANGLGLSVAQQAPRNTQPEEPTVKTINENDLDIPAFLRRR